MTTQSHEQGRTAKAAAAQAGISVSTMKRLIGKKRFPAGRAVGDAFNNMKIWRASEIDQWLRGEWQPLGDEK